MSEHGCLERKCDVCNYRKELADATTTIARLEAEVARLQLAVEGEKAVRHMAVCRLGGLVGGRPTHEGNFLQRIDALVRLEAENAGLRAEVESWRLASGKKPEDHRDRWKALYVVTINNKAEWRWQPLPAADATDAAGWLKPKEAT